MTGRVLQVLEATIGGTKRHVLDLSAGLHAAGWDVDVACPRVRDQSHGDVSFWDDLHALGVPAHEVPMTRLPFSPSNAKALVRLSRLIGTGRYDVVHAHSSIAGALARPAALLAGIGRRPKLVYSPHGFAFLSDEWGNRGRLFLASERVLGRFTDRVIAVSPGEAEQAVAHGIATRRRVAVVQNGVVSSELPATRHRIGEVVPELAAWDGAPLVGTLARMLPQKDPLTWIRVAARVAEAVPDARFVWIWGGGSLESDVLAETERLGLRDRIEFLGHRPDARRILAAFDVFLLTSRFEGLPYSVIEALAAGTPVVASDVDGTHDVVRHGETGLLAPGEHVEALANNVVRLLSEPHTATCLGAAGRTDVLERFSTERMVERTASLYRELLHRSVQRR